jgi:hypothetical protein
MKNIYLSLFTLPLLFTFGCAKDNDIITPYSNIPVVAYTQNAFAYTLVAHNYSATADYDIDFNSDSLAYSLVISNYKSGDGQVAVFMQPQSSYVYAEQLNSNKVISFTQNGISVPRKIHFEFDNFSGSISFSLAKSNGN